MKALLRIAILLAGVLAMVPGPQAAAQSTNGQAAASRHAPAQAATGLPISPAQARDVLETLNDPKKRAAFTATLEAIARSAAAAPAAPAQAAPEAKAAAQKPAGQPTAGQTAAAPPTANPPAASPPASTEAAGKAADKADDALPLRPDSVGARLLVTASNVVVDATHQVEQAIGAMVSLPSLWHWVVAITTNEWGRGVLTDTSWRLLIVFGAGVLAQYLAYWFLRRPRAGLAAIASRHVPGDMVLAQNSQPPAMTPHHGGEPSPAASAAARRHRWQVSAVGMLRRLPLTLGRLCLDLLPVLAFVLVAHLVIGSTLGGELYPRLVLIALTEAYAMCAVVLCVARAMFSPGERSLRLFDMTDENAGYAMRWSRRIAVVTVFGYALGEAGRLLGLSDLAREALMKGVGLIDHIFVAIIVLQKRRAVRSWLRAPAGTRGVVAQLRNRIGAVWHWVALFYLAALWLVWAVEIPDGFSQVLRFFAVTAAVLIVTRIALILLHGTVDRVVTPTAEMLARYPGIAARLRMWRPVLHVLVDTAVYVVTLISLLEVWGIGAIGWLTGTDLGRHVAGAVSTTLVTLGLAMVVWEAANHGIERHLARLAREAQLARSARLRTLLPMLRTTLLATIMVIVGLLILSEIGLNIAPLLAGAGVLGIAIGFGSQKLVQDVITGLFLLMENTVQVGDVVSVGGLGGVVEDLSVRTIRLRSEDGSVHVIPFSAVSTVTNMTRDYSRAVINIGVAYKEDYDRVVEVMRSIVAEMRKEPRWEGEIHEDMEVWGLDSFADSAIMIKARIKCGPFGRWSVMREFHRRMKQRFDQEGIEIPFPQRSLVLNNPVEITGRPRPRLEPDEPPARLDRPALAERAPSDQEQPAT